MTDAREDALEILRRIRFDLTAAQAKVTDAMKAIAAMPATPTPDRICPTCGVVTRGPLALAEHVYTSHDGPVPEHYLEAERLAGLPAEQAAKEPAAA